MIKKYLLSLVCASLLMGTNVKAQTESNNVVKINLSDFVKEYEDNGFVFHKKYDGKVLEFDTKINWISNSCWFISEMEMYPCLGISRGEDMFGSDRAKMKDDSVLYSLHKEQEIKLQCLFDAVDGAGDFYYKNCIIIQTKEK